MLHSSVFLWLFTLLLLLLSFLRFSFVRKSWSFSLICWFPFFCCFASKSFLDCISKGLSTDPILPSCVVFCGKPLPWFVWEVIPLVLIVGLVLKFGCYCLLVADWLFRLALSLLWFVCLFLVVVVLLMTFNSSHRRS